MATDVAGPPAAGPQPEGPGTVAFGAGAVAIGGDAERAKISTTVSEADKSRP